MDNKMDLEYDRKFAEMKKYIPFLESMIRKLENTNSPKNPRQAQLDKIKSLRDLLLDNNKRMKMENLLKCEQVLINLYNKVEQREGLPDINKSSEPMFPSTSKSKEIAELNTVRQKLKSVVIKSNTNEDMPGTLPEIARASEADEICLDGSKEPALFQRRPNKPCLLSTSTETKKSPPKPKRSYTRILKSPEPSSRRWSEAHVSSPDKPLFSRRSPRASPHKHMPAYHKKERQKSSSQSKKGKSKDFNITLKVPEESLKNINSEDILSRIINCSDSDVDIDTLRILRTQILGELKQTGANNDISDLIMKSYKKKKTKKRIEVEEGELSDSESEAIQNIYGSIVVVDKDKTSENIVTEKQKPHRIQICLVFNNADQDGVPNDKDVTIKDISVASTIADITDFEMFDKGEKTMDVKKVDVPNEKDDEKDVENTMQSEIKSQSVPEEVVTIDDCDDINKNETNSSVETCPIGDQKDANHCIKNTVSPNISEKSSTNPPENISFKANFYKPISEQEPVEVINIRTENKNKESSAEKPDEPIEKSNKSTKTDSNDIYNSKGTGNVSTSDETGKNNLKSNLKEDVEIPLLNEGPIIPAPPKEQVVSEIDILQALKNEILSESIAIPGTETVTPPLHQPKVTKVASAKEIMNKKTISIEKYKEMSVNIPKTPLFVRDTHALTSKEEQSRKQSLKLTEKECERFNFPAKLALDQSSDEDIEDHPDFSLDDIYGDLAPKSPEQDDSIVAESTPPIIIPMDPIKSTIASSKADVDMRKLMPVSPTLKLANSEKTPLSDVNFSNVVTNSEKNCTSAPNLTPSRAAAQNLTPSRAALPNSTPSRTPASNMTSNRTSTPNMTPNRITAPNSTPSRAPAPHSTPSRNPNMTPNTRPFETTPSHQSFEIDDQPKKKHVYAPIFDPPDYKDRRDDYNFNRLEEGRSIHSTARFDSSSHSVSTYRRHEAPLTPVHTFGRSDCPSTPTNSFGRREVPLTPVHPFGRDHPSTPSPFDRPECPLTPSHPFGRSDCPMTPTHPFGRPDMNMTPSHPFGRSDYHQNRSNAGPKFVKDPRLNRSVDKDLPPQRYNDDRDRNSYYNERRHANIPNRPYNNSNPYQNFGRERSIGRGDMPYEGRESAQKRDVSYQKRPYNRDQTYRESSGGQASFREYDNDQLFTSQRCRPNKDYSYEDEAERFNEGRSRRNYQRAGSATRSLSLEEKYNRSSSRVGGRNHQETNDNTLSVKPQSGRSFTIDTSVSRTFQEFLDEKGIKLSTYTSSFDARRQRATSVGRSLAQESVARQTFRESSVGRTLVKPTPPIRHNTDYKFLRARSVGRDIVKCEQEKSFKDIKDDFKSYSANFKQREQTTKPKTINYRDPRSRREFTEMKKTNSSYPTNTKTMYSPNKNNRDPRIRREQQNYNNKNRDRRNYGIVYSNDNISKGTILGSGYGVKNYKIPKIKRPMEKVEDVENVKVQELKEAIPVAIEKKDASNKKQDLKSEKDKVQGQRKLSTGDKKQDVFKTTEKTETKNTENGTKPLKRSELNRSTGNKKQDVFKSTEKTETKNTENGTKPLKRSELNSDSFLKDNKDTIETKFSDTKGTPRAQKSTKKSNILDSDAEFEKEEDDHKIVTETECTHKNKIDSPIPKPLEMDNVSNNSFGIDELEIFSENLASDPVIDNISDLIADLDDDIGDSKTEKNNHFTSEITLENMLENITGSEITNFNERTVEESLKDLNELINEDLNRDSKTQNQSSCVIQQRGLEQTCENFKTDALKLSQEGIDTVFSKTEVTKQNQDVQFENSKKVTKRSENIDLIESQQAIQENLDIKIGELPTTKAIASDVNISVSNVDVGKAMIENDEKLRDPLYTTSEKVQGLLDSSKSLGALVSDKTKTDDVPVENKESDAVVSTTESEKEMLKQVEKKSEAKEDENVLDRCSTPDSTINTDNMSPTKSCDKDLPDSTNAIQNEINSDVTSTYDSAETSSKNAESTSKDNAPAINMFENLLSLLRDKSKMQELLSMLGDTSSDSEKIKENLVKLSDIVSDDLNTNGSSNQKITDQSEENDDSKIVEQNISVEEETTNVEEETTNKEENSDEKLEVLDKSSDSVELNSDKSHVQDKDEGLNLEVSSKPNKAPKILKRGKAGKWKKPATNKIKRVTRSEAATLKNNKPKKPSRELRQLQNDIKEMFISDDILNSTGIRMCRLIKLVDDKNTNQTEESFPETNPVVVLEKFKGKEKLVDASHKVLRKKSGPKTNVSSDYKDVTSTNLETPEKTIEPPKILKKSKHKPGPKSKTRSPIADDKDPYAFETDSINEKKVGDEPTSSDSESDSMTSSQSFGSSEALLELKKKTKRKRGRGWKAGVIKTKKKKKIEKTDLKPDDRSSEDSKVVSQKPTKIPDMNCFTDKTYCFLKNVSAYPCRLCDYYGNDIVHHYKRSHPHKEIPLSRMNPHIAREAIEQCEDINFEALSKIPTDKYTCRFCFKEFGSKRKTNNLEAFFWHVVSTHTGEYKQLCCECINVTRCPFFLDIPPPPKDVKGQLIGYICGKCNFTQISLENLKAHVIVRHNDEETEVCTINLAVMTKKTISALMKQSFKKEQQRVLRSSRSNQSVTEPSDDRSDFTDSTDRLSEFDSLKPKSDTSKSGLVVGSALMQPSAIQTKLTFENETMASEPTTDSKTIKIEDDNEADNIPLNKMLTANRDLTDVAGINAFSENQSGISTASGDIVDYPHFKISYTNAGGKEYVCCINRQDNHYKTSLLISMKKHVQTKHSENWDGFCYICKVIVTAQGKHTFKECLQHFLDKHLDNFPVLERTEACITNAESVPVEKTSNTVAASVEKPTSKPYINVRPISELLSNEQASVSSESSHEATVTLPKIQSIVSFGGPTIEAPLSSPTLSILETELSQDSIIAPKPMPPRKQTPVPDKPQKYEEAQAEVMSKKHQAVLTTMMSHDKLVKIYKCAGRFCNFTSDSFDDALKHASTHQRIGGENALLCAYCDYDCSGHSIELVMHVFQNHGGCQFACSHCFYRAVASQLVRAHMIRVHGEEFASDVVLKAEKVTRGMDDSADPLPREVAVQHYTCFNSEYCKFKTYTQGKFVEHLMMKHEQPYPCSVCQFEVTTPNDLVHHLKTHDLKVFQCTWCVHGADNEAELLAHASSKHPNKQPQAYLRVITTNKDNSSKMMVLPLAQYNKSLVQTKVMSPGTNRENPVREAERSIELEKLINSMIIDTESKTTEREPDIAAITPLVEESITPIQVLPPSATPPSSVQQESLTERLTPILKTEMSDETPAKTLQNNEVICLDSDDECSGDAEPSEDIHGLAENTPDLAKVTPELAKDISELAKDTPNLSKDIPSLAKDAGPEIVNLTNDEVPPSSSSNDSIFQKIHPSQLYVCPKCSNHYKRLASLKYHFQSICYPKSNTSIKCFHCPLVVANRKELYWHYQNDHCEAQSKKPPEIIHYVCGICNYKQMSSALVKTHMKNTHENINLNNLEVSDTCADNNIIKTFRPKSKPPPKRKLSTGNTEVPKKRKRYGPQDVDDLPTKPILDELVYCALCEFSSKVRSNLVRHLQGHADKQPVAESVPLNPVPHLETNEMHFDKMVNLASSSIVTRAPEKPTRVENSSNSNVLPPEAASGFPKYVPDRMRYTCGAPGCSYISNEALFKCHWETLHSKSNAFHCVHCPPQQLLDTSRPLSAVRIIAHLKMHDTCLYACSACRNYHYKKQILEKHLVEVHKGAGRILVVREEGFNPSTTVTQTTANTAPTMDLKPWQCGMCKFKSMLRPEVVEHCAMLHNSKMQFKCPNCPYRTSTLESVKKHHANSHPASTDDVIYYYYREGSIADEPDGTPRWMKQRKDLGIVEEPEVKTEVDVPSTSVVTPLMNPVTPVDLNLVKQEVDPDIEESIEDLCKRFGQFCEPNGLKYKCPLCKVVMEDNKDVMQSHLFEELKYRKWGCSICSYKAFHKPGLNEHMSTEHRQNREPVELPLDIRVEKWVAELLNHQTSAIEKIKENFAKQRIQVERPRSHASPKVIQKPAETCITEKPNIEELEQAFGPRGSARNAEFCCPKCEFCAKQEDIMRDHLESELNKIRWRCSVCNEKFQEYHEAQLHCRIIHPGQGARPAEALRDPNKRAAWVTAVINAQKLTIPADATIEPQNVESNFPTSIENSLLVVRFEERVPTPEEEMLARRKRPAPVPAPTPMMSSPDSDDERLIIDEPQDPQDQNKKIEVRKCPHCDFTSKYNSAVRDHILRHYHLKPFMCGYCNFNCYVSQTNKHTETSHPGLPSNFMRVQVPDGPPTTLVLPKRGRRISKAEDETLKANENPKKDDEPKVICLVCEKSMPESESQIHVHEGVTAQFAKKGDVVVKCCNCLALLLNVEAMKEHHHQVHSNAKINYAFFKLHYDTREIHCCGHCTRRFKFIRDLRSHHNAVHNSLQLKYTMKPYLSSFTTYEVVDDNEDRTPKRSSDDACVSDGGNVKRCARKSTTKLPYQRVAKKSTTKLPLYYMESDSETDEEYSYYGRKPTSLDEMSHVTALMPFLNTMMEVTLDKCRELLNIEPKVLVKDIKK